MSTETRWIVIPNWRSFQHYRDRTPKWVKTYTELLSDDAYLDLTGHQRAVLHGIWLEYASSRCHLRVNSSSLSARLSLRVMTRDLEALNHAGFIEFAASAPLAEAYEHASPEKMRVRTPKPPTGKDLKPGLIRCDLCRFDYTPERIEAHRFQAHGIDPHSQ